MLTQNSNSVPTSVPVAACYLTTFLACLLDGVTVGGYTTIPSPTRHSGSRPTSGSSAFQALKPFALTGLNSLNLAIGGLTGLGGSASSQDFASVANAFGTAYSGEFCLLYAVVRLAFRL